MVAIKSPVDSILDAINKGPRIPKFLPYEALNSTHENRYTLPL